MSKYHTLIISDLHLGARICRTEKILKVLSEVHFKNLIINGDLFDSNTVFKFNSLHWQILSKISLIAENGNVFLVGGNHGRKLDPLAKKMGIKILEHYSFDLGGKKFLCLHGDEFDMYIKKLPLTSDFFTKIYYLIQRIDGNKLSFSTVIKRLSKQVLGISRRQQRLAFERGRSQNANVIICSHTHIPHMSKKDEISFFNSGSFCSEPSTFITVEKNGTVMLNEV